MTFLEKINSVVEMMKVKGLTPTNIHFTIDDQLKFLKQIESEVHSIPPDGYIIYNGLTISGWNTVGNSLINSKELRRFEINTAKEI